MEPIAISDFVKKLVAAYNNHRVDAFDELLADDCVLVRNGVEARGRQAVERVIGNLFRALPDVEYTIDDIVIAGDKLALRWRGRGTHKGEYLGVAPTNRELRTEGITLYELRDDKLAKIWVSASIVPAGRGVEAERPQPQP